MGAFPEDGEVSTCRRCGRPILFDRDDPTADDNPYGWWTDQEHGTNACTPGLNDEDHWHEPTEED